jgi:hypothetical protein
MTCLFGLGLDCTGNPMRVRDMAGVRDRFHVSVKQVKKVSPPDHPGIQCSQLGAEVLPEDDHPRVNVLLLAKGMAPMLRRR